jgi:ubiquinone/menaquinone biosynthesis C-methylase UbiE
MALSEPQAPHIFSPEYYRKLDRLEQRHPWSAHMQQLALVLIGRFCPTPERVLDAGCGAGYFTALWREQSRARLAVGIDASFEGLGLCRGRGLQEIAAASVQALPLCSEIFDVIYCADVLQHLSAPRARETISEFARVLRPGGIVVIRAAARRGIGSKKHRDTEDYQQWEPQKLAAYLEPYGFQVDWMSLVNWLPSLAADIRGYQKRAPAGDVGLQAAAGIPEGARGGVKGWLLAAYWAVERFAVLRLGARLPGGHTLLCVARKR